MNKIEENNKKELEKPLEETYKKKAFRLVKETIIYIPVIIAALLVIGIGYRLINRSVDKFIKLMGLMKDYYYCKGKDSEKLMKEFTTIIQHSYFYGKTPKSPKFYGKTHKSPKLEITANVVQIDMRATSNLRIKINPHSKIYERANGLRSVNLMAINSQFSPLMDINSQVSPLMAINSQASPRRNFINSHSINDNPSEEGQNLDMGKIEETGEPISTDIRNMNKDIKNIREDIKNENAASVFPTEKESKAIMKITGGRVNKNAAKAPLTDSELNVIRKITGDGITDSEIKALFFAEDGMNDKAAKAVIKNKNGNYEGVGLDSDEQY